MSSELEQARPQTSGEEELQLQLALAMSREVAEQVGAQAGVLVTYCPQSWGVLCKVIFRKGFQGSHC